jgi:hypothetical protein
MDRSPRSGTEEWRQIIDGRASSGLLIAAYCLEHGITEEESLSMPRRYIRPLPPRRWRYEFKCSDLDKFLIIEGLASIKGPFLICFVHFLEEKASD